MLALSSTSTALLSATSTDWRKAWTVLSACEAYSNEKVTWTPIPSAHVDHAYMNIHTHALLHILPTQFMALSYCSIHRHSETTYNYRYTSTCIAYSYDDAPIIHCMLWDNSFNVTPTRWFSVCTCLSASSTLCWRVVFSSSRAWMVSLIDADSARSTAEEAWLVDGTSSRLLTISWRPITLPVNNTEYY